jgi:hypothetical protein
MAWQAIEKPSGWFGNHTDLANWLASHLNEQGATNMHILDVNLKDGVIDGVMYVPDQPIARPPQPPSAQSSGDDMWPEPNLPTDGPGF